MPVFEIGLEDGRTLHIEADDQQAALAGVSHFQAQEAGQQPSGMLAGAKHGVAQAAHGIAETAKQNFGIGNGYDSRDPNYVPADPYKPSQWGQLLTENIPSMGGAIAGGKAAAAMAPGKWKIPAALLGATGAGWLMSSGDTIKERAANNGRDEPNLQDKIIGNLTSGAASAAGAVPAARLVPGLTQVTGAGGKAVAGAVAKALTTLGTGAAGGAASDLATQVGTTSGTDKGLTVDPTRLGGSAITGGVTAGAMAGAPLTGDLIRAGTLRKFVGDNEAASKNYATRLEAAGNGDLGNSKVDETAHKRVMGDLKTELGASAANVRKQVPNLSPEADNTLSALQRGEKVNPDEIARIDRETAGAPDGANTALLARTLHVADMAGERGGHSNGKWSGGISGAFDRNVGYMLNPFRSLTGALATGAGVHLLGTASPQWAATAFGTYGAARMVDNLTGMRSPAKTFAEHFADRNATLRVPTQQPPAPPAPPNGQAQGPWGPKPLPQQSVPQAGQQPPQPQMPITPGTMPWQAPQVAQLPNINPVAASMLAQKLKAGLPAEPQAPAAAPAAPEQPQLDPLNLPTSITKSAKNLMGGAAKVQEIREKEQARTAVAGLQSPLVEDAPLDVTQNPMVGKRASQLVSAANALRKYTGADVAEREQAQAEAQAAREEKAAAKEAVRAQTATERAQAMAERAKVKAEASAAKAEQVKQKEAAKVELAQAKAAAQVESAKVKAAAAKVKATKVVSPEQPKAEAPKADKPYEPIPDELLNRKGLEDGQVAAREVADYAPHLREKYAKNIVFRRSTLRNHLEDIAGEANDVDSSAIGRLYHQMDHSHSQRDVQRHLAHWTAKMDPATKQAIHAAVAPLLKLWKE